MIYYIFTNKNKAYKELMLKIDYNINEVIIFDIIIKNMPILML